MRDDVVILLNEREPLKRQMAEELEQQLKMRGLVVVRLDPSPTLAQIILERNPRIVVLDFLLADITTALDILTKLQSIVTQDTIKFIVWTDEPSVGVAVSAMKLGAKDYIELAAGPTLEKVIRAIDDQLSLRLPSSTEATRKKNIQNWKPPVGVSGIFRATIRNATRIARQAPRVAILKGPAGCGRNTMARYIHEHREDAGQYFEYDVRYFFNPLGRIFGQSQDGLNTPTLSFAATTFLDNLNLDAVDILHAAEEFLGSQFTAPGRANPMLLIGCRDDDVAEAWHNVLGCPVLTIPALADRHEDFLVLAQTFLADQRIRSTTEDYELTPELLSWLQNLPWTGNIQQYRAALFDAWTTPRAHLEELAKLSESLGSEFPTRQLLAACAPAERALASAIIDSMQRWEQAQVTAGVTIDPLTVRLAIDRALGNLRIAAASLSMDLPRLRHVLGSDAFLKLSREAP